MNTDTPLTDAAAFVIHPNGSVHYIKNGGYVGRDTCEKLETRLAHAEAQLAAVTKERNTVYAMLDADISKLRTDLTAALAQRDEAKLRESEVADVVMQLGKEVREQQARIDTLEKERDEAKARGDMGYSILDELRAAVWKKPGFTFVGKNYEESIGEVKRMNIQLQKWQDEWFSLRDVARQAQVALDLCPCPQPCSVAGNGIKPCDRCEALTALSRHVQTGEATHKTESH